MDSGRPQNVKTAVLVMVVVGTAVLVGAAFTGRGRPAGEFADLEVSQPPGISIAGSSRMPDLETLPDKGDSPSANSSADVVVHVAGKVMNPGVYTLPAGSRVIDAVKAAGGHKPTADTDSVNLAARLVDGEQIRLLEKGEPAPPALPASVSPSAKRDSPTQVRSSASRTPQTRSIDINTASAAELDRLPGVGPATAASIIEYRHAAGGFVRPEDLMNVKGIGEKKYADMKPYVVVR